MKKMKPICLYIFLVVFVFTKCNKPKSFTAKDINGIEFFSIGDIDSVTGHQAFFPAEGVDNGTVILKTRNKADTLEVNATRMAVILQILSNNEVWYNYDNGSLYYSKNLVRGF